MAAPANTAAFSIIARLLVITIILWCFSTQARAQAQPETAQPTVKKANGKLTTPREATGKPASVAGGSCDFGVVVTTGDEFAVQTTGLTIFQNRKTVVPIPGWGLSDLIFARTRAAVPAGASVLRIPYNSAKFPPRDESKDTLKDRLFRDPNAELAGYMREAVKGTNCRHYIQILNAISPIGSSSYTVRGFGILNQDVVLGRRIFLHALAFIRIFDGRDFAIVRQSSALINLDHSLAVQRFLGKLVGGPYRELPAESFPTRPEDAASNPALRDGVRAMLAESLDKTLPLLLGRRPAARPSDIEQR
ncbi:hypothetical protein LPJ38_03635 [Bradyrhizobium daqingense]|uniref:Permuted papain-like amidase YaeF/Yiix C92 family enzyme n=1 Tax=Bradyrhizobium daqingense TaxID=993502 RepID=A0A562LJM8_9BRAD|nr:hypothetical protein [Bradyrhizobium daqingense]TWI07786.1 hypothetical protein IQ17_02143 [Bradyrhizobium daqingense]UFS89894.1 hypothetical protein LPJ38_03635 [Bradyrhizobium daqingense]